MKKVMALINNKEKNIFVKKEIPRDILAFGSWIFYILVIARALIKPYRPFVDQLVISGIILLISELIINHDTYTAKAIVLVFFTSLFYQDRIFTIFAFLVFLGLIFSSYYCGNKKLDILKGLMIGTISIIVGYYGANLMV